MSEQGRESVTERALVLAIVLAAVGFAVAFVATGPVASRAIPGQGGFDERDAEVAIGLVLVGAGLAIALVGGSRATGLLAVIVGIAWFAIIPAESAQASDPLRGPGQAVSLLLGPALLGLLGALIATRRTSRRTGWSVAIVLGLAGLVALLRLGSYDPFADPTCVSCRHAAPVLVATIDERRLLDRAATALAIASAIGLLWLGIGSLRALGRPRAGRLLAVIGILIAGAAIGGGTAHQSIRTVLLSGSPGDPALVGAIEWARTLGGGLLVIGLAWLVVDVVRVRVRMRNLAVNIATATELGTLDGRLADALNDQSVVVGYWLESEGRYVSRGGMPVDIPSADAARTVTIERRGQPIAAIWHRQGLEPSAIRNELTPSLLVALDNERLQAAGMANLHALQTSRARLVAVQEEQRRQIERDLHDSIQQRLLAIVFSLRLARTAAERSGERQRSAWLDQAEMRSLVLVEEVRQLAHGIHPAILSQAGLAAALASLAELSPIPITVAVEPSIRLSQPLEAIVYQVIVDALADSVLTGAGELSIAVRLIAGNVAVDIDHDGATASPRVRLVDRVAAAGGSLSVEPSDSGSIKRLRVVLPCA